MIAIINSNLNIQSAMESHKLVKLSINNRNDLINMTKQSFDESFCGAVDVSLKDKTYQYWGLVRIGPDGDKIVASALTASDDGKSILIDNVCRLQDDKYKGTGKILMAKLIHLLKQDVKDLIISAYGDGLAAYYESFGFKNVGNDPKS